MTENERVRKLRKDKGLNQSQFAARFGLAKSTISEIETGYRALTHQNRLSICREFGVNEQWLRTGEGEMYTKLSREAELEKELRNFFAGENDSFRERLIRLLLRMPSEQWELLAQYAQQFVAENELEENDSFPRTGEDYHVELDRQLDAEEKKAAVASLDSGRPSSGEKRTG